MKKIIFIICLLIIQETLKGQVQLPFYPDSAFSAYYHQRRTLFESLPPTKGDVIFIGNSITDGGEWSELFRDRRVKNRGISGDISAGVIRRIREVVERRPDKVFLMIGVNDLARGITPDSLVKNILGLADYVREKTPGTKLFIQSILPVNPIFGKFGDHTKKAEQIKKANEMLAIKSADHLYCFINLFSSFSDGNGRMDTRYSNDGLHLLGEGYLLWKHLVFPHVYGLQEKPSLLPLPGDVKWKESFFPLYDCKTILVTQEGLERESAALQEMLLSSGGAAALKNNVDRGEKHIELRLGKVASPVQSEEAYKLDVSDSSIRLTANTPHGIFNGLQTLRQLMRDGVMVDACEIMDWPAFSWRGFMTDAGRNYQSMTLLKEQIDVMSRYKLNVFHFHATEDIAWRIAIKKYPQLTAPETMLRDKGLYYTEADLKELIQYCRERYITFVPEIDMPGHSAAFKRAMKTDMQSDTGLQYVKNILQEFCKTYDVSFIHIGADEVKIMNRSFVPEVTRLIEGFGKKVIGWQPGGNFTEHTIRQLWMDDNAYLAADSHTKFIDSRHLYLNHMDPLESVVTIFNRKIGDKEKADSSVIGGTICVWHDRAVADEKDILRMNPVYPGMLAFAERSWRGGGQSGWIANISDGDEQLFSEFENRLMDSKQQYFQDKIFTYTKQSGLQWQLYGPFSNGGDLTKKFLPETTTGKETKAEPFRRMKGGTIIIRHWWAPLIKGAISKPVENTTWYAATEIWCEEAGEKAFWIDFNNISRSPATDSPPAGEWDYKGSAVWVNGKPVNPPQWKRAGQRGNPEIPLADEGYAYREAVKIFLQKGLNTVLVKVPVGSFKGKDWQNPVKWMFTCIPVTAVF